MSDKWVVARKLVLSFLLFLIVWFSGCEKEGKFDKNNFFVIPSSMVNLPYDWQDKFVKADNLNCLTLTSPGLRTISPLPQHLVSLLTR